MWRAGLPALGGEATPKTATAVYLKHRGDFTGAASRPNAGKPARHNKLHFPQQAPLSTTSSTFHNTLTSYCKLTPYKNRAATAFWQRHFVTVTKSEMMHLAF